MFSEQMMDTLNSLPFGKKSSSSNLRSRNSSNLPQLKQAILEQLLELESQVLAFKPDPDLSDKPTSSMNTLLLALRAAQVQISRMRI